MTPSDRLHKILCNVKPSVVKFKAEMGDDNRNIVFTTVVVEPLRMEPNDDKLQDAVKTFLQEFWDFSEKQFKLSTCNVAQLFDAIKSAIIAEYEKISSRSTATKRKTINFIREIALTTDVHLANFLLTIMIEIASTSWDTKPLKNKQVLFENFESLRRVYGNR